MLPALGPLAQLVASNRRGCQCTLGGFLLSLALSLDYSYPNLNTYIVSYLRQNGYKPIALTPLHYMTFPVQPQPLGVLRGLHLRDGGQEPDPGPPQLAGRLHLHRAGGEEHHSSRVLHPHVSRQ